MKLAITALVAGLALTPLATAAEKPDTARVTYTDALTVWAGLSVIGSDGYQKITKEGGVEKQAVQPWEFTANTRRVIGRDMQMLRPVIELYNKTRQDTLKQYFGFSQLPAMSPEETSKLMMKPEWDKFQKDIEDLNKKDAGVDLLKLSIGDLKLDANPIQGQALSNLSVIITEDLSPK